MDVDLFVCFLKVDQSLLFLGTAQLAFSPHTLWANVHCCLHWMMDGYMGVVFYSVPVVGFLFQTLGIQPRAHVPLSWTLAFGSFEAGPPYEALLALNLRPCCLSSPSVVPGLQASHYAHLQPDV